MGITVKRLGIETLQAGPGSPHITVYPGGNFAKLARGHESARTLLLERILARRAKPGEAGTAVITWGGPSQFGTLPEGLDDEQPNFRVNIENPEEDPPPDFQIREYNEVARTSEDVRVENPDDPNQYVIVQRVESITFSAPDGIFRKFNFRNVES